MKTNIDTVLNNFGGWLQKKADKMMDTLPEASQYRLYTDFKKEFDYQMIQLSNAEEADDHMLVALTIEKLIIKNRGLSPIIEGAYKVMCTKGTCEACDFITNNKEHTFEGGEED